MYNTENKIVVRNIISENAGFEENDSINKRCLQKKIIKINPYFFYEINFEKLKDPTTENVNFYRNTFASYSLEPMIELKKIYEEKLDKILYIMQQDYLNYENKVKKRYLLFFSLEEY